MSSFDSVSGSRRPSSGVRDSSPFVTRRLAQVDDPGTAGVIVGTPRGCTAGGPLGLRPTKELQCRGFQTLSEPSN